MNGTKYSVYNRHENLILIDYFKTNRMTKYTYNTYTKQLNKGSMQYQKIFEKKELIKKDYIVTEAKFPEKFKTETKNKINYVYTNETDGFGFSGYKDYDFDYLENTYKYYTEVKDMKGSSTKYTYDGLHQLKVTEELGKEHKEVITSEHDEMKLVKKRETEIFNVVNGKEAGRSYKKIENYRYDEYGNLTNYTGPLAQRDQDGYPLDTEHTVIYSYDYDRFHSPLSKTWKQDQDTICQIIYTLDNKGNIVKETNTNGNKGWIITDFQYDSFGNISRKEIHSTGQSFITNYEYSLDANGVNHKGAYLTKEYSLIDNIKAEKKYAYDFNTGNLISEIDQKRNSTNYEYDVLARVVKSIRPDSNIKEYTYIDNSYLNSTIIYKDTGNTEFKYEYDILGDLVMASVFHNNKWNILSSITYDSNRNKIKEVDSNGHSIRYQYDSKDRLILKDYYEKDSVLKGSSKIQYDAGLDSNAPLIVTITDEEGYPKKFYYDILNRLVKTEFTSDKVNFIENTYTYDYVGNKITFTDEKNNITQYEYDDLGRLVKQIDALENETYYEYNSLNQIALLKEPEEKNTAYYYDSLGRLGEKRTFKEGDSDYSYSKYSYDIANNLTNLKVGNTVNGIDKIASDTTYVYDIMNRITDEYDKIDGSRTGHTKHSYDSRDNKIRTIEYVNNEKTKHRIFDYSYDYAGRVTSEQGRYIEQDAELDKYNKKSTFDYAGNLIKEEVLNKDIYDITSYLYDYRNQIIERIEPYKSNEITKSTKYKYDKTGNLVEEKVLRQGVESSTLYIYDGLGRVTKKTDALGNTTRYAYDQNGNLSKEVDPRYINTAISAAPGLEYEYDELNRLVKVISFDGTTRNVISYREYDGRGNLIKEVYGEGYNSNAPDKSIGQVYQYDVLDRVVKYISAQTFADNQKNGTSLFTKRHEYDGVGNVLTEEDGLGNIITNTYYLNGLLKSKTYPDGNKETFNYDLTGKMYISKADRANNLTQVFNNLFESPYKIIYPDGTYEGFIYSTKGQVLESHNRAGNVTEFSYDQLGNMLSKREFIKADSIYNYFRLTKYSYDEANALISSETYLAKVPLLAGASEVISSVGDKVTYIYDKVGRLTKTLGPITREIINEYDAAGNLITIKQKVEGDYYDVIRYTYDSLSRVVNESLLVKMTDIDTKYLIGAKYDNQYFDRVLSTTSYTYNKNNTVKSKKAPQGNESIFEYDYDKRLIKNTNPMLDTKQYVYDLNGNLIKEENSKNMVIHYDYDSFNRLIRKISPAADGGLSVQRYIYDTLGNLIKQISPENYEKIKDTPQLASSMLGTAYTYDNMNRRTSTTSPKRDIIEVIQYDEMGNVRKTVDGLRYTGDIQTSKGTSYKYDGLGRVLQISNVLDNNMYFEYDVLGNLVKQVDGRKNTTSYTYNPDKTLAQITYANGGTIQYTYDNLGRKKTEKNQLGNLTSFVYTAFSKEKEIIDPYLNKQQYKYDLNGNLVASTDKIGSTTQLFYDKNNRMVEKRIPLYLDGSSNIVYAIESYVYDSVGNIIRKSVTDSKEQASTREAIYTYYDNDLLESVTDNSGGFVRNHYNKNGSIIKTEKLRDGEEFDIELFQYDEMNRLIKRIQLVDKAYIYGEADLSRLTDLEYPEKI